MSNRAGRPLLRNALPPEGILFVVILGFVAVCAILRNVNMLVMVSGMMFAPLLLCWRLSRHTVRHVVVARLLPIRIHAGQSVIIQWTASNHSRITAFNLSCTDTVRNVAKPTRRNPQSHGVVHFRKIPSGQTAYASYRVLFARRGVYELGPAIVASQFPLPLVKCWFRTRQVSRVCVAPQLGQFAAGWRQVMSRLTRGIEFQTRSRGPQDEEFFSVRRWRSGDNMRKIHWRSTAKYRQPMVKQFDGLADHDLTVVLDLFLNPADRNATRSDCESILSFAATLIAHWAEAPAGRLAVGVAGSDSVVCASHDHPDFVKQIMRQLAVAQLTPQPDIGKTICESFNGRSPGSTVVVFSPRQQPELLDVLPVLRSRVVWMCSRDNGFAGLFSIPVQLDVERAMV